MLLRPPDCPDRVMIDLHYWPTPNGHKIAIFLEEAGLEYQLCPVNIAEGEQFRPEFLRISPNNRIPAIVDHDPADGGEPISLFESGAILEYLAEKTGRFLPADPRRRWESLAWLYWQVGGLGPMLGQNHHFNRYAPEKIPYAIDRYTRETMRLYRILDRRLAGREFIADEYSIADMACYPWIVPHKSQGMKLEEFTSLENWFGCMRGRPAVRRAYALAEQFRQLEELDESMRRNLFGQTDTRPADS